MVWIQSDIVWKHFSRFHWKKWLMRRRNMFALFNTESPIPIVVTDIWKNFFALFV